jgi:putative flippase GtrA
MEALIRYCLVGVFNALTAICVMVWFASLGLHYAVYSSLGYFAAFISSYTLNGLFTFKIDSLSVKGFVTFLAINAPLLGFVNVAQVAMIDGIGVPEWMGVGISALGYTVVGFHLNRRITYRQSVWP